MKKCYFILSLILASSTAFAAVDKNYGNMMKEQIADLCWEMMTENGAPKREKEAKQFCKDVARCIVNNAPNNFSLTDETYFAQALDYCSNKEVKKYRK